MIISIAQDVNTRIDKYYYIYFLTKCINTIHNERTEDTVIITHNLKGYIIVTVYDN